GYRRDRQLLFECVRADRPAELQLQLEVVGDLLLPVCDIERDGGGERVLVGEETAARGADQREDDRDGDPSTAEAEAAAIGASLDRRRRRPGRTLDLLQGRGQRQRSVGDYAIRCPFA